MWTSQWGCGKDLVVFSHRTYNSKGILIAFRESINYRIQSAQCDVNGRYIIFEFNVIFHGKVDAGGENPKLKDKYITKIISMMSENDLCDIYRVRNSQSRRHTWRCQTPLIQQRLDYFLVSDQLQGQIEARDIIPSV